MDKSEIKVGISMPTQVQQRWNRDGDYIQQKLMEKGYQVDLEYAYNSAQLQIAHVGKMIQEGCKAIIIAPFDADSMDSILDYAKLSGVTVISYDRLVPGTNAVDYYVTFDNMKVGVMQGTYIVEALGLQDGKGPYFLEIMAGASNDSNADMVFEGAMSVLRPYIQNGQLVVASGEQQFEICSTPLWKESAAKDRMTDILNRCYKDRKVDAVLCSNDSLAMGVIAAVKEHGYSVKTGMPVITGQDADKRNVKAILHGDQSMSVFKDTRMLAAATAEKVDEILTGKALRASLNTSEYGNGKIAVPTLLIDPQFVDRSNCMEVLVESGYYTEEDITIKE